MRSEVVAGRWFVHGRHTVAVAAGPLARRARLWQAIWESGAGAVLDGAAALEASGLRGFDPPRIDVSVPRANRHHVLDGVRIHRRSEMPRVVTAGIPRVRAELAAVHAASWARSDREAALILCLVVQQRLTTPERLLAAWRGGRRAGPRRPFVNAAVVDICDGAQALGELDFAGLCRARGLPEPSRQSVVRGRNGRVHLDARWKGIGLVVEIDGGHHQWSLNPVADALRQNDLVVDGEVVLRIPVLGLRLDSRRFMDQVVRAHERLTVESA
ncbi:hypothetical protein [Knoellia aerolata]|uniref:hypothetical protein n=1 Tax=Knoellia aerolata TaxID=442954 RepID=UPI001FE1006E|nr:hypothetical protein [Knoellia aerolata]